MIVLILVWVGLLVVCIGLTTRPDRAGTLLLSYFLGLSLIHVPGAINFLGSAPGLTGEEETRIGFQATVIGLTALLLGSWLGRTGVSVTRSAPVGPAAIDHRPLGKFMITFGAATYFILLPVASFVPSLSAVLGPIASLLILGFWILIYDAIVRKDRMRLLVLLVALPVLPLSTLATGGFIGYGIYWMIAVVSFMFVNSKKRIVYYCLGPIVAFVGLSLAVAYLAERSKIREAVWEQNAGYAERLDRIFAMADSFKLYDWNDAFHVYAVDQRLNQNFLVGVGIERHERGGVDLFYGETIPVWMFIPRAIWPEKPEIGGGRSVVTDITGITFAEGVSVGAGQPLEFYANFGWPGLIGGFVLLGFALMRLDLALARALRNGDLHGILFAGLPGLVLLQPGGNGLEILVALVGALVAAGVVHAGIRWFGVLPAFVRQRPAPRRVWSRNGW